jgi:diguanylate cyclase (GGDEF)-like protein
VISLKRFLARDEDDAAAHWRLVWLILEAVACHAVEADPAERQAFQDSLRALAKKMEESDGRTTPLVLVGEAIKTIETYNRSVQRALGSHIKELQSIVSLFTRSILQVSKGSAASANKLHQIERQIEKSSQSEDLRAIKVQLEQSLEVICEEAAEQERRSADITDQIHKAAARPESAAALSEAVGDIDLITGLPNQRAAEQALRSAAAEGAATYVVLLCVDRLEVINSRFGFSVGDRILMLFGQHLAQKFSNDDRLFRWRGPGFLALLDRSGPESSVRAEVTRMVSARLEQQIELGERSVLLPIAASWMLANTANCTFEKINQQLDAFSAAQFAGSQGNR